MIEQNTLDDKNSVNTSVSEETKARLDEHTNKNDNHVDQLFANNEKYQVFEQRINNLINYINLSIQDMEPNQPNVQRNFSVFDQSNFKIKKEVKYEIEDHINGNVIQQKGLHSLFQDAYQQDKQEIEHKKSGSDDMKGGGDDKKSGGDDKKGGDDEQDQIDKMMIMSQQMAESIEYEEKVELDKMVSLGMSGPLMRMLEEQSRKNKEEEEKLKNIKKNIFKANKFYCQLITSLLQQMDKKQINSINYVQQNNVSQQIEEYQQQVEELKEKLKVKDEWLKKITKENEYLEMKLSQQKDTAEVDLQLDEKQNDINILKTQLETKNIELQ